MDTMPTSLASVKKDVSVGEYDPRSGLTHVTRQRGRLLFNMGASARKWRQQQQEDAQATAPCATKPDTEPEMAATTSIMSSLTTGTFTGLSLYPEEAFYLVQRGALAVFLISGEGNGGGPMDAAAFVVLLVRHQRVSLACLEVYAFLKGEKLHPRRCLEPSHDQVEVGAWGQRRAPRHVEGGGGAASSAADDSCPVAFDVWKAVSLPSDDATPAPTAPTCATTNNTTATTTDPPAPKRVRRLQLVFRVLVSRFDDPPPGPRALRRAVIASQTQHPGVPVKAAVVSRDRSVLLLELASV